jgi:hypothetical protein
VEFIALCLSPLFVQGFGNGYALKFFDAPRSAVPNLVRTRERHSGAPRSAIDHCLDALAAGPWLAQLAQATGGVVHDAAPMKNVSVPIALTMLRRHAERSELAR